MTVLFPPSRKSPLQSRLDLEIPCPALADERMHEMLPTAAESQAPGSDSEPSRMPFNVAPCRLWPKE